MLGFNDAVFDALREKVQTMDPKDRCISLMYDEMALKSALVYNHRLDRIEGFEDTGELGMSQFVADHTFTFMVRGLYTKWKQHLGYFLIIRGRGGNRDNPNPQQFWGSFRYVVADQLLVHSRSANCTVDPVF